MLHSLKPLLAVVMTAALAASAGLAQAKEDKIRIAYPSGMNGQIPVVMDKAGIAAKHGLDATFAGFPNGPPMMEGLVSGQLDAVVTSFLPPATLSAKLPGSVTIVASLGYSSYALLVPKDSKVTQIGDLRGRRIGVSFSTESQLDLLIDLKKASLDSKSNVTLVNLSPGELPAAFEQGLVDAVVIRQPQSLRLEETRGARAIKSWPFYFVSIVRSDYLKQNPDAVKKYIEALKDSVLYIATNPEQASSWFGENQRIDPAVVRRLAPENPLYTAKDRKDLKIDIDPAFRKLLDERLDAIQAYGLTKDRVPSASLLP